MNLQNNSNENNHLDCKESLPPDKKNHKSSKNEDIPERERWENKAEFVLSCVGLSVGIGNFWRFPYIAYQNGGGAFLFPYIILLFLVGKPLYFLETAIGQYSNLGPMAIWKCFPIAKGVGVAMVILSFMVSIYYNIVMSYTLFYMAQSFRSVLPWSGCYEWWGADTSTCYVRSENQSRCIDVINEMVSNYTNHTNFTTVPKTQIFIKGDNGWAYVAEDIYTAALNSCTNASQTAAEQFWERYVLDLSSGIEEIGYIKWDLALCVLGSWAIVFLCLMKGVKSSGKVVYFSATFPYVVLFALLIYGAMLDGAIDGIYYFFVPSWEKLLEIEVWRRAAEQLFYSLSVSWGGLILYGSYNKFSNKVLRDAVFVSSLDFATSLVSGVVIFSVLGNTAKSMGLHVKDVVRGDQGLVFIAYPEALVGLWVPQLWSLLFFLMLYFLGVDSEFAYLETLLSCIYDEYPKLRTRKHIVAFIACLISFFLGLPCVTQGGQYVFNLMDTYSGGLPVLCVAAFELIALMWGYGVRRLCDDFEFMLGFRPGLFWQASWAFISPLILAFIFIMGLVKHEPITYHDVPYPLWAEGIGWAMSMVSIIQIPLWAIIVLIKNRKNIKAAFLPTDDWGPGDKEAREKYFRMKNCNNNIYNNNNKDNCNDTNEV